MTAEEQVQADIARMRSEREAAEPKPKPAPMTSESVKETGGNMMEGVKALLRMGHRKPGATSESGMTEVQKQLKQLE